MAIGQPILPRADRVRYDEAASDLRQHYQTMGARNLVEVEKRLAHLDKFFLGRRLTSIGGAEATAYVAQREEAGAANGTIKRELGVLKRMLGLAYEQNKLLRRPVIRLLKAGAPGMLRHDSPPTAVRNLVASHVSERVAMTITGHKTRSVFDRYHIVSDGDLREASPSGWA